ncbi:hypothetical protein AV656_02965 [Bhargavaea cecembensis]|uniref:Uncharacterized protein n=1 Tax=Bhargavaea cecembensis TaxID=394098 RepID=A0A161SPL2_9BACL|nr:hypothetical protein [Bhargavaea cecembensis]KZE40243.1 hypothetical protein AV656_02965 [Bhargavaea cecembensis]
MNWDLLIGLIIGLSGSILGLAGTIWTNKQNHDHEIEMAKLSQTEEMKRFVLDNSFKEYEFRTNLGERLAKNSGKDLSVYPYDMYLVSYSKIADYLQIEQPSIEDLEKLIQQILEIQSLYEGYNHHRDLTPPH